MSSVTTVLVLAPYIPEDIQKRLLDEGWDIANRPHDRLTNLTNLQAGEMWGGSKYPEAEVFGGGFNYFDEDKFLVWLSDMPWERWRPTVLVAMSHPEDSVGSWGTDNLVPFRIRGLYDFLSTLEKTYRKLGH
jgi:hypothetical protein